MVVIKAQTKYYVTFFEIDQKYKTIQEIMNKAPKALATHLARSNELYKSGKVIMAGSFLDEPDKSLTTMGVFYTREDAEEFAKGDPFVLNGMVIHWYISEWANILKL